MAAASGGAKGGYTRRNSRRRQSAGVMHEINVTPLVDVMLVLLIVFMVAAPLMVTGIKIELPKTEAKQLEVSTEPISIALKADGTIYIQNTEIAPNELLPKLVAIAKNGYDEDIVFKGEPSAYYESVMNVLVLLKNAGYNKISLQSDQPDQTGAAN